MKFKDFLISLTFLLGCCALTSALSDYEAEGGDLPIAQASSSEQLTPTNEDIFESAALQQEIAESSKKLADLDLEMESETEVSVKSVRNISNNQISPDYGSLEYQNINENIHQRPDESTEAVTANEEALNGDTDEVTDIITKAKSRMGRLLPTTTTIPSYLRRTQSGADDLNQSQENLNLSMSDYAEDDERAGGQQTLRTKPTATQSPAIYEDHIGHQKRIHDKGDDIVPLAMKYYDVDDEDDGDSHRHHRHRYQDNDDDDYNVEAEGGVDGVNNKLNHNAPVPMPRQQLLEEHNRRAHRQRQQQHQPQPQQNSSEEYYDEEQLTASKEDESSTHRSRSSTTPSSSATQVPDNNVVRALFAGFPFTFNPTTTAPAPAPTTTTTATTSIDSLVTPITQYDPLFVVTTTAPGAHHAIMQTFNAGAAAAAPALPGDKKGKQIPIIGTTTTTSSSTSPSSSSSATTLATGGSHSRRRLLPHEQLRNYIEDAYIRMPLAVIVDPSTDSLEKTKSLWNDALRTNLNIKIVLVTLNESDIPAAFNFNNTRQFLTGLNSIKEHEGGDAFRGISHAAELVPYDSAVFISTATLANHTDQVHDAAITLLKKRIRLYLIWFGERALSENETQESVGGILGEVAIRSGGEVLHIVGSENSQELEGSTLTIVADAFRGSQEVDVPVDTTLSSLHVKIDKLMRRAVLETPNGEINLKKLVKFKSRLMMSPADDKRLDAYVPLTKLRKATIYKLKMIPEDLEAEYSVFIRGERKADTFLDDMIKHFETYFYEGQTSYPARFRNSRLQSITSALAIATVPTHSQLRFPTEGKDMTRKQPKDEVETFSTHVIHKNPENGELMPSHNDTTLTTATAAAAADTMLNQRSINVLQRTNTKIEMGIHSQVLIAPGMIGQLYFDVTNTGCNNIYYTIQVVDEMRYLMKLAPQSLFLQAGQMATVTVTVLVPQSTQTGTVDHITFSATGGGSTTSLSLNLKVITTQDAQDNTSPSVSWDFGSRCDSIAADSTSCSERFWSLFITAQDWQTGILRVQSTPNAGLIYSSAYTVGATEPLKASYIATCCEPKVSIVAYDVAGNQRSYNIDVRDLVLNEASIAAIVLGAILLILIIILIIAGIVWCCRRRKVVLDLPTYRSHSTRSME